jgi:dipeptidyl aminopeptidase/acylaminoacyl peptidase
MNFARLCLIAWLAFGLPGCQPAKVKENPVHSQIVTYSEAGSPITLRGLIYKPPGDGPFPAVLYNHGSAPGMENTQAFDLLGPVFAAHGWVLFAPYRQGQGLSAEAGPYILDEIAAARRQGGPSAAAETMVKVLATDHLADQTTAFNWLSRQPFVQASRIATMGNSFGGVEALFGAQHLTYCAAIDASGGAESWAQAPELQAAMITAVNSIPIPVLFFQARNDYDVAPSLTLYKDMVDAGKVAEMHLYPAFGSTARDEHSLAYRGIPVWETDVFGFLDKHCGGVEQASRFEPDSLPPSVRTGRQANAARMRISVR